MTTNLATQIRDYALVVDTAQAPLTLDELREVRVGEGPVSPVAPRPEESIQRGRHPLAAGSSSARSFGFRTTSGPTQAWVSAAAAAMVVLLLVGGMAWLLGSGQPEDPVTSITVTPTTVTPPSVVPTTLAPTTTIVGLVLGEGPMLEFTRAEAPDALRFPNRNGVWFDGALYINGGGPELFRSSDGFTWEPVPLDGHLWPRLIADGERLVAYEFDGTQDDCEPSGIVVSVSTDGSTWSSSRIDLPVISLCDKWEFTDTRAAAVGSRGIVISASARPPGRGTVGHAWFSEDGSEWLQIDSGELLGLNRALSQVVAGADGFLATVSADHRWLWESADGLTWTTKTRLPLGDLGVPYGDEALGILNGTLVVAAVDLGVWTVADEPRELVPIHAIDPLLDIQIGPLGLFAVFYASEDGTTDVLFSVDGTAWNRWTPQEFGNDGGFRFVAVGNDFVVLEDGDGLWVGDLR